MLALSRDQVRSLDRIAVERYGIPGIVLMENAGLGATLALLDFLGGPPRNTRFGIVTGKGNNGGDGFVIARQLANRGYLVSVVLLGEPDSYRGPSDAGTNFEIVQRVGLPVFPCPDAGRLALNLGPCQVLVDAILGTGLTGEVRGLAAEAIGILNASDRPVIAVDIPSGLDCDGGRPLGRAVRADFTVTFAAMKKGFLAEGAADYTGRVEVVSIGCPLEWE